MRPLLLPAILVLAPGAMGQEPIAVTARGQEDGSLRIEAGGGLFAVLRSQGLSRPIIHPLVGPGGAVLTRKWPVEESADEERDHPHHKGLWFAHGDVNGHDFWSEGAKAGRIEQVRIQVVSGGTRPGLVFVKTTNRWVARDGTAVATDTRSYDFAAPSAGLRTLDVTVTMEASTGGLRLGDTKEGTFALRLCEALRVKRKDAPATGHYLSSEGVRDAEVWGKRAAWVDAFGKVGDATCGVAILDHPKNPAHPTWWHARDYGLFAANPFGVHDFEKKPAGAGDLLIPAGESRTWRWRLVLHAGDPETARIHDHWKAWAAEVPPPGESR